MTDETESLAQIREAYRRWDASRGADSELFAAGDRVVMLGRCGWRHRRSGIAIDTPKADFLRRRAGRIVEFYEFFDTAMALAAARGESP